MGKSSIGWTEHVWNPIRGCSRISEGCRNCYAERMAARFCGNDPYSAGPGKFSGFASMTPTGPRWTGRVELIPEMLHIPLKRRKPTTYFVNSMSDLFHESLAFGAIDHIFGVIQAARRHRFIILTKRARRMREYVEAFRPGPIDEGFVTRDGVPYAEAAIVVSPERWPLPNVILGVSCEDQAAADERIPHLLALPAACRMVSLEPLLGPINLYSHIPTLEIERETRTAEDRYLDWVILGGESGPGARPMHPDWVRTLRDQCTAAEVPFLFKQWGEWLGAEQDGAPGDNQVLNCSDAPVRVGKRAAGRLLDGRVWDERPEVLR